MEIILVTVRAFDRESDEAFINKSMAEIHAILYNMCYTYIPISVRLITVDGESCSVERVGTAELKSLQEVVK